MSEQENEIEQWDPAQSPDHRSGFVSVIGRPNVGKSTLMNAFLGQKISIVSPKPQTTRRRVLGILTRPEAQLVFVDTPGIHDPSHKLGEVMVETAVHTIPDGDIVLWLVDGSRMPRDEDRHIADLLRQYLRDRPLILGLNKSDLVSAVRDSRAQPFLDLYQPAAWTWVSAVNGENQDHLMNLLIEHLPLGPRYYPEEQVTDQSERVIVAELIREQILLHAHQEVPHAADVFVDEFKERDNGMIYIHATVIVERASHKGILLGKGGQMMRRISQAARKQIQKLIDSKVYLEIWIKVRPKWREDENQLRRLGYRKSK